MRNQTYSLTPEETAIVERLSPIVSRLHASQRPVRLDYVKRNGEASHSIGTLSDVFGDHNKTSVIVHTDDKGPRTVNLYRVTAILPL